MKKAMEEQSSIISDLMKIIKDKPIQKKYDFNSKFDDLNKKIDQCFR